MTIFHRATSCQARAMVFPFITENSLGAIQLVRSGFRPGERATGCCSSQAIRSSSGRAVQTDAASAT
jgi:hypothetical protein